MGGVSPNSSDSNLNTPLDSLVRPQVEPSINLPSTEKVPELDSGGSSVDPSALGKVIGEATSPLSGSMNQSKLSNIGSTRTPSTGGK